MHLFFVDELKDPVTLNEDESRHFQVLRIHGGDTVIVSDGKGHYTYAAISEVRKKAVTLRIGEIFKEKKPAAGNLTLAVAPTKSNDRTEWLLEKAVEIGVGKVIFVNTKNTERNKINLERFGKIVRSAAKQSLTFTLPKLEGFYTFPRLLEVTGSIRHKFIALCDAQLHISELRNQVHDDDEIVFFIGPEGGFTDVEKETSLKAGFKPVRLSAKRLRTETASIFVTVVFSLFGDP